VHLDGTLIRTDRCKAVGPTAGVDLWWSGKHHHHGGNIQVVTAPDGWPLWTSPVRPGGEHDTTCARTHDGLLDALTDWTDSDHVVLADLGYEGENTRLICPIKNTRGVTLTVEQRTINALHSATRALAERGNSLLKTHLQRPASGHPVPVADRRDHRRGAGPAAPRTRPHHMIILPRSRSLLGKAHCGPRSLIIWRKACAHDRSGRGRCRGRRPSRLGLQRRTRLGAARRAACLDCHAACFSLPLTDGC
jgi:hypothetical protein